LVPVLVWAFCEEVGLYFWLGFETRIFGPEPSQHTDYTIPVKQRSIVD